MVSEHHMKFKTLNLQDDAEWNKLLDRDAVEAFRKKALNPHGHAVTRGGAENDDIYFQGREAQNLHEAHIVDVACEYFEKKLANSQVVTMLHLHTMVHQMLIE